MISFFFISEVIWPGIVFLTWILSRINSLSTHPLDLLLSSPILPFLGLSLSIFFFQKEPSNFHSWGPLIRFSVVSVFGLIGVHYFSLLGLEHQGPGLLGSFGIFLFYAAVEGIALIVFLAWGALKIGATAPASAHISLVRTILTIAGVLFILYLGFFALKTYLDNLPMTPSSATAIAEDWNSKNPSHEYLSLGAESSASLVIGIRINIHEGWGENRQNLPVQDEHLHFFSQILQNPDVLSVFKLPQGKWTVFLKEGQAFASWELQVRGLKRGEYDEKLKELEEISRNPSIPWNWLREAYDRASKAEDFEKSFSGESRKIATHYIQNAELMDEYQSNAKILQKLNSLKSKGSEMAESDCASDLLASIRYNSFLTQACNLMKLSKLKLP